MSNIIFSVNKTTGKRHPEWSYNAVIYEVNIRQYTPEGTLRAFESHIPRLKELGVDILWFMPIHPIGEERRKGTLGSYYSIRDYTAVNPEFGSMADFTSIVESCHRHGMKVLMDWVPNHTSRDAVWTKNREWYELEENGEIKTPFDWTDTAKLNYSNPEMRSAMVEAMRFWLTEAGIDGFRVDMAMLVPTEFWNETVPKLEVTKPDIFMLCEAEGPEFHDRAFDMSYTWETLHLTERIARGENNADTLRWFLGEENRKYQRGAFRMFCTSNHDENSWSGSEFTRYGDAAQQFSALTYILPTGMPLIYSGQEAGQRKSLEFFEKDEIDWSGLGGEYSKLYKELNDLRHTSPALASGERGGDLINIGNNESWRVFSVKRQLGDSVVIAVFNFSAEYLYLTFDNEIEGTFRRLGSDAEITLTAGKSYGIAPHGFQIYYK